MELDRETIYNSIRERLYMPDDSCEKESTPAAYLSKYDGDTREFVDFRHGSFVFFTGGKQEILDKKLANILIFMDQRKDFELYLAGSLPLNDPTSGLRLVNRENLSLLLVFLEEKLKQRKAILDGEGATNIEEYNEKIGRFIPYLSLVIDQADIAEKDPSNPLSKLISLLYEYADHGFRVITASAKKLNTRNGRILQGDLSLEEASEADLSFVISHGYDTIDVNAQPREIASDPIYEKAVEYTLQKKNITTAMLQRKFRIGYSKAIRIIEEMRRTGVFDRLTYQDYQKKKK